MIRGLIFILILLVQNLGAQRLHFSNYPLFDQNVQIGTNLIAQHASGLIYVSSGDRLFSFNGTEYLKISLPTLNIDRITTIYAEKEPGTHVWLGMSNGSILKSSEAGFEVVHCKGLPEDNAISGIVIDSERRLWIATYGGGVFVAVDQEYDMIQIDGISSDDIYNITSGKDQIIWLSTDAGISSCTIKESEFIVQNYNTDQGLNDEIVKDLIVKDDKLIIGTHEKGVSIFDVATKQFRALTPGWRHGAIRDLTLFDGQELWIVTERQGVFTLSLRTGELDQVRGQSLESIRHVKAVLTDREGNIWLCSPHTSLERTLRQFEYYKPEIKGLQSIYPLTEDIVFLGSDHGIYEYDLKKDEVKLIRTSNKLNIISMDRIGDFMLFGTFDKGVRLFDINKGVLVDFTKHKDLTNNSIISIAHTSEDIWLATLAGLYQVKYKLTNAELTVQKVRPFTSLSKNYTYDILVEDDNSIYFATDGQGVAHLKNDQLIYYNRDSSQNSRVHSLAKGTTGAIWAVENAAGLVVRREGSDELEWSQHATSSEILAIASDGRENILVLHRDGIDILNEIDGHMNSYGIESGFDGFDPQLNAIFSDNKIGIFAAGHDEVLRIIPRKSVIPAPDLLINYWKVGDIIIDQSRNRSFAASENTLQINLQGLFYTNPESIKFRYILEGHDNDWKETSDKNIIYSKLEANQYKFKVYPISSKASHENENMATLEFEILKPLWQRWWFLLAAFIMMAVLLFAIMRYREKLITREKEMQKAVLERQYEVLKNQLNPHFLFNAFNTLVSYIEEDPRTAVEVVGKLSDFYRKILVVKEHKLVPVHEELELLQDYVYILNKRFGNNLHLNVNLNGDAGFIPPMTLQILVENVIKHNVLSASHPLYIELTNYDRNNLILRNNLKSKRNAEQSTGIGLKNIDNRYRLLGEQPIRVVSDESSFAVILPKILTEIS